MPAALRADTSALVRDLTSALHGIEADADERRKYSSTVMPLVHYGMCSTRIWVSLKVGLSVSSVPRATRPRRPRARIFGAAFLARPARRGGGSGSLTPDAGTSRAHIPLGFCPAPRL